LDWLHNSNYNIVNDDDNNITVTKTFSIDDIILKKLRIEANKRDISLNVLINQIFKNFVEWYVFEPKVGLIPISKPIVINLFKDLKKEEVVDIATEVGKNSIYDIALFMKMDLDLDSFLEWFESRIKNSSMKVFHFVQDNTHTYTIKHDICLNWSLYHKVILEFIFIEKFKKNVRIQISEGSFRLSFEK
jgi:hypothetical protein